MAECQESCTMALGRKQKSRHATVSSQYIRCAGTSFLSICKLQWSLSFVGHESSRKTGSVDE